MKYIKAAAMSQKNLKNRKPACDDIALVIATRELDILKKQNKRLNHELEKVRSNCKRITNNYRVCVEELENKKIEIEKRTLEMIVSFKALKTCEEYERFFVRGVAELMYLTSHKVRRPITNIVGIVNLLDQCTDPDKVIKLIHYLKDAAVSLDVFTRELSSYMQTLELKAQH